MTITRQDIDNWFVYHPPTQDQIELYDQIRDAGLQLATVIRGIAPDGVEKSEAIMLVRKAVMMANAAIACRGK